MFGLVGIGDIRAPEIGGAHLGEGMSLIAPIEIVGGSNRAITEMQDSDEAFRLLVSEGTEKNGIDDAEECCIRANAEGQGDDGDSGKAG